MFKCFFRFNNINQISDHWFKTNSTIYPVKNLFRNKHGEKYVVESNRTGNILFGIYIKKEDGKLNIWY